MALALIDGNAFYVSCERVFRPALQGKPVIVLSNNDGCAIARSNEARALGIKMGQPWHELRQLEESDGLIALSANFALYGDMSDRMMSLAAGLGPHQEIYSIDECFVSLDGVPGDHRQRAWALRERVLRWIGIPCGIGIGETKTLAKLANHVAKTAERKPGSYPEHLASVCDLSSVAPQALQQVMAATEVGDVWGVGPRLSAQLIAADVRTALDLSRLDPAIVRRRFSVTLERTVRELQGVSCLDLEEAAPVRQQVACTRSFGHPVTELDRLGEAVSEFGARVAEKLRRQGSLASQMLVFIRTSPFRPGPQYSRSMVIPMRKPTSDTAAVVGACLAGLRAIFRPGIRYAKAGVMALDLQAGDGPEQIELDLGEPVAGRDRDRLMQALDCINDRWGKGTLKVASAGAKPAARGWRMRQDRRTPAYTTSWEDMPVARS